MNPNIKFFDSHIHLNSCKIKNWNEAKDWVFNNVSTNLQDLKIALNQSDECENVYVTAGIHPLEIFNYSLEGTMKELNLLIKTNPKIIAIGETGLDFYKGNKEEVEDHQKMWLFSHIKLAQQNKLPIVFHIRNAHEEFLEFIEGMHDLNGVIHCYEGNLNTVNRYLNLPGKWMLSVSPLIYRDDSEFRDLIRLIPIDRLLVETDSPYLASGYETIIGILQFIAEEKKIAFAECQKILLRNFYDFFNLN